MLQAPGVTHVPALHSKRTTATRPLSLVDYEAVRRRGRTVNGEDLFIIIAERPVEGMNIFPIGGALTRCRPVGGKVRPGQSPLAHLEALAREAGVRPLLEFFSEDPESSWFTAEEGVATIRELLDYLSTHTEAAADVRQVLGDLRQFERVLKRLNDVGALWHLEDGSWW